MDMNVVEKDPTDNLVKLMVLEEEIEYYETLIQPHDTGHIHTTIHAIEHRKKRIDNLLDSWRKVNE